MQTLQTRAVAILGAFVTGTASLSLATAANADVPRARVSYADLDVRSHDGRTALASRISHAADAVCGADDQLDRFAVASCRAHALDHAYADLQQKGVTIR